MAVNMERLMENNYASWKMRMRAFLIKEDLFDVIEGTPPVPPTAAWKRKYEKVQAFITLALSDSQLMYVRDEPSARRMWDALQDLSQEWQRRQEAKKAEPKEAVRSKQEQQRLKTCYFCGARGHIQRDCAVKQRNRDGGWKQSSVNFVSAEKPHFMETDWILDSGASHTLVKDPSLFHTAREVQDSVLLADGSRRIVKARGMVKLNIMKASAPARIVNVSSFRHHHGKVNVKYLNGNEQPKSFDHAYNSTKLMNVVFTTELARRLQGTGVIVNAQNPGAVKTEILRNYSWWARLLFNILGIFFLKAAKDGAVSTLYCAISEEVEGITGKYFDSDCSLTLPSPIAQDPGIGSKLWDASEKLTGLENGGRKPAGHTLS
ncbi:uncharacterized protein LOC133363947 isoform X1 [Rhineura floridana]|uniref:uncharacterized protein LOC133363947 isoform X1 n=1 Tax=Rhineura floridana TaxID=261503 RepID=UPI002AC889AE|nr:uncharacterized protein LOC133363947 isoform X1 [Rhineura floridana]